MTETSPDQPAIKALLPILLRILFGLVIGVVLSEIILAVTGLPKFHNVHSSPSQFTFMTLESGEFFYINKPSESIEFIYENNPRGYFDQNNAVQHKTNSLGFRGQEYTEEKDENTIRIAFLGDSFTFGEGVKDEDIYSNRLVKKLNEDSQLKKFEAYNFGVGGYNTEQSVFLLKNMAVNFDPDIVVLGYTLNDAEPKLFFVDEQSNSVKRRPREMNIHEGLADKRPPDAFIYKFRASKLFWQVQNSQKITQQTINYYNSLYENGGEDWDAAQSSLREFTEICRESEFECYFIMFPLIFKLDDGYPFHELHSKVKAVVEPTGIPIIDVLPSLLGKDFTKLWVHPTDQHPNEIVHGVVADLLFENIERR